jgi:hypothetical protein
VHVRHGASAPLDADLGAERAVEEGAEEVHGRADGRHGGLVELRAHGGERQRFDVTAELGVVAPQRAVGVALVHARGGAIEDQQVLEEVGRGTHGARPYVDRARGYPPARRRRRADHTSCRS